MDITNIMTVVISMWVYARGHLPWLQPENQSCGWRPRSINGTLSAKCELRRACLITRFPTGERYDPGGFGYFNVNYSGTSDKGHSHFQVSLSIIIADWRYRENLLSCILVSRLLTHWILECCQMWPSPFYRSGSGYEANHLSHEYLWIGVTGTA